jgi:1,4-alpha-glucan branching enzyme
VAEWNYKSSLEWNLLQFELHAGVQKLVKQLNRLYKTEPALYEKSFEPEGFEWLDFGDNQNSTISYVRKGKKPKDDLIIIANLTPVARDNYRIGLPSNSPLALTFNSDDAIFGGSQYKTETSIKPEKIAKHNREYSAKFTLPPLSVCIFKRAKTKESKSPAAKK